MGATSEDAETSEPLSSLEITAPFRGTILDRERIVPGVAVDPTRHIFMLADLNSVWIEASVHESNYALLAGSRGGTVELRTPAYPDRVFEGQVFYTGDLVDEQSRGIKTDGPGAKPGSKPSSRACSWRSRSTASPPASRRTSLARRC